MLGTDFSPFWMMAIGISLLLVIIIVFVRYPNKHPLRFASVDHRERLQRYGRDLISSSLTQKDIISLLTKNVMDGLSTTSLTIFLRSNFPNAFTIHYQHVVDVLPKKPRFGLSHSLAKWLADHNDILTVADLTDNEVDREEIEQLRSVNAEVCVPLLGSKHLLGWVALPAPPQPYSDSDLLFLTTIASHTTIALENAELLNDANHRAAELEALQKISLDIQAQAEPDALLKSVVQHATELLNVQGGLVWLLEPNGKQMRVKVSHNLGDDLVGTTLKRGEGVAGRVWFLQDAVAVDDYGSFTGHAKQFKASFSGAVLGVPLLFSGQVGGVLELVHRQRGLKFKARDVSLMKLFASQSSIALEKSRLLQEAQRRANQLTTLSEVGASISRTLDLDTALTQVMHKAIEILNAEAGSLLLVQPSEQSLKFEVVIGSGGEELVGATVPVGSGIAGMVAQNRQPQIVNDAASDPRWDTSFDEKSGFHTQGLLCVAMVVQDRVIGVIEVVNKKDLTSFTDEDVALLTSFALQAAIVIENAQIFTRVDQALATRMQELETLHMFDETLQSSLNLDRVLDVSLTYAMDALGIDIGMMGLLDKEGDLYLPIQYGTLSEFQQYKENAWSLDHGVIGRVCKIGKAELIKDVEQSECYITKARLTRSMLVVPVLNENVVVGCFNLESIHLNYFTEDDLRFVQLLAGRAAFAIQNARLFTELDRANQAKSDFMNTASHDLKVPMTSIKGYAKMLKIGGAGPLNENQQEFVEVIDTNINRMSRLVNDLLDVSRIEAGRVRLELTDFPIRDVIEDVLYSVRNQIDSRNLTLNVNVAAQLSPIRADYHRIVQIMTNLVSNAYKYTPDDGTVTITAKAATLPDQTEGVSVAVQDTGYGISEEDQANLFKTFFRASDPNVRQQPGTGLGLSITKKMIESHGGLITVKSTIGVGSTFTVTLPRVSKVPAGVEVVQR